jgi:hypothetical protein
MPKSLENLTLYEEYSSSWAKKLSYADEFYGLACACRWEIKCQAIATLTSHRLFVSLARAKQNCGSAASAGLLGRGRPGLIEAWRGSALWLYFCGLLTKL